MDTCSLSIVLRRAATGLHTPEIRVNFILRVRHNYRRIAVGDIGQQRIAVKALAEQQQIQQPPGVPIRKFRHRPSSSDTVCRLYADIHGCIGFVQEFAHPCWAADKALLLLSMHQAETSRIARRHRLRISSCHWRGCNSAAAWQSRRHSMPADICSGHRSTKYPLRHPWIGKNAVAIWFQQDLLPARRFQRQEPWLAPLLAVVERPPFRRRHAVCIPTKPSSCKSRSRYEA